MKVDLGGWTPVALSTDLSNGGVLRTVVEDQDLAIWRSAAGAVRAWENRCPHRGMRLSYGFVRGETLTCIYHGWQYGTDGVCHAIPAHPDLTPPTTLCVRAFGCVENSSLVWASLSQRDRQPKIGVEDIQPIRSLTVDRPAAAMNELFATVRFPIADDTAPDIGEFRSISINHGLIVREGQLGDQRRLMVAALQALPGDRTAAHILTSPAASPKLKTTFSRWLERLRWFAEKSAITIGDRHPIGGTVGE
ncbi:MAG: Rieske (2Fe-2S) protein [Pseudomonadota bacterium]